MSGIIDPLRLKLSYNNHKRCKSQQQCNVTYNNFQWLFSTNQTHFLGYESYQFWQDGCALCNYRPTEAITDPLNILLKRMNTNQSGSATELF